MEDTPLVSNKLLDRCAICSVSSHFLYGILGNIPVVLKDRVTCMMNKMKLTRPLCHMNKIMSLKPHRPQVQSRHFECTDSKPLLPANAVLVCKMSDSSKPASTPWKDLIKKTNIHKRTKIYATNDDVNIGIRQEWRHFKPKEKVFILKAIHTCTNAKEVNDVLNDFVNAAHYINKDRDFLIACFTVCLQNKMTLGAKFKAMFRYVRILL